MNQKFIIDSVAACDNNCGCEEKKRYCEMEIKEAAALMQSITDCYETNPIVLKMAELLIGTVLLIQRTLRHLKTTGLIITIEGERGPIQVENPLLSSLHQHYNRVVKILKELKLTPKERTSEAKQLPLNQLIQKISEEIKNESIPIKEADG